MDNEMRVATVWRVRDIVAEMDGLYDLSDCSYDNDVALHDFVNTEIMRLQTKLYGLGYVYKHGELATYGDCIEF